MRNFFASYFQASSIKLPEEPHFKIRFDAITIRPLVIQVKNKNDLRPRGEREGERAKDLSHPFCLFLKAIKHCMPATQAKWTGFATAGAGGSGQTRVGS